VTQYTIRRAEPNDLEATLAVLAAAATRPDTAPRLERQREAWGRMIATQDLTIYLADHGTEPVGTATMLVMPHLTYDCAPTAFIEAVVVTPRHRRRGVARQLLGHALDDARTAGCLKVQLLSHKRHADDGAHRLYETAGFIAEAEGFRLYLQPWQLPT
jgi:GNAT superfamily N-acetyltransferase